MNRYYKYFLLVFCMALPTTYSVCAQEELYAADEDIEQLFADDNDQYAQAAAETTIMQQEIEIKPVSKVTILARKMWDRLLVFYLWCQQKYARVRVYLHAKFQRQVTTALTTQNTPEAPNASSGALDRVEQTRLSNIR